MTDGGAGGNDEDVVSWATYKAIDVPPKGVDESWDLYLARATQIRIARVREVLARGSRPTPDLLLRAAETHGFELVYLLLAGGMPVNTRIDFPDYDEVNLDTAEEEESWRELYALHGRNALELCSNATRLFNVRESEEDAWTLTKLVILAGGTGDPIQYLGSCFYEEVWYGDRHMQWLRPLLGSVVAPPQVLRRWWLSDTGAHARWKAFGGELVCLIESLVAKPARSRRSRRLMGVSMEQQMCCIEHIAQLPKPLRRIVAKLARPERSAAITQLFRTHACGGDWDEEAFKAIA
jgi:hypothetical protein